MKKYNTDIQPLSIGNEIANIGNPIDVADIITAQQSLLTIVNTLYGFGPNDFWILDGITEDNSGNYSVSSDGALVYLNGKFLYLPAGSNIVAGQCIINSESDGIPKQYGDTSTHNKYHLYTAGVGNTPNPPTTSPAFDGSGRFVDSASISLIHIINIPYIQTLIGYISTLQSQVATLQSQIYAEPSWNNVTALHSWTVSGFASPPLANARFKKDNFGWVELDGAVIAGTYNTIAFKLPYSIAYERDFSYFDGTNNVLINIDKTGNVTIGTNLTGTCLGAVSLSGIRFRLD